MFQDADVPSFAVHSILAALPGGSDGELGLARYMPTLRGYIKNGKENIMIDAVPASGKSRLVPSAIVSELPDYEKLLVLTTSTVDVIGMHNDTCKKFPSCYRMGHKLSLIHI